MLPRASGWRPSGATSSTPLALTAGDLRTISTYHGSCSVERTVGALAGGTGAGVCLAEVEGAKNTDKSLRPDGSPPLVAEASAGRRRRWSRLSKATGPPRRAARCAIAGELVLPTAEPAPGHAFSPVLEDVRWLHQIVDQLTAIEEAEADMEKPILMDRGDLRRCRATARLQTWCGRAQPKTVNRSRCWCSLTLRRPVSADVRRANRSRDHHGLSRSPTPSPAP